MKIIGISGFEQSIPFQRRAWPGVDERELRISQGHDSAAALVVDGRIVAAVAEERLNRRKHTGDFPKQAIEYCLRAGGLRLSDIDRLAHAFDYGPYRAAFALDTFSRARFQGVFSREALLEVVARDLPALSEERVVHVPHHDAHAWSAYATSGWDDCLVAVIDGMGEVSSATIYETSRGKLIPLHAIGAHDSIGVLYSLITLHLGFDFNADEYKVMGLAPYGDPARFRSFFEEAVLLQSDGGVRISILHQNRGRAERDRYLGTRAIFARDLMPARKPDSEITDEHRDLAAAVQECLDRTMLHICGAWRRRTGQRRLALAGGVALNCTANGRLIEAGLFDEIYIQPAAGDDGSALGAALRVAALVGDVRNERMHVPFLGPSHDDAAIEAAVNGAEGRVHATRFGSLTETCAAAAKLIASGKVVGWYRGAMEFGPRALGHRSILADPGVADMRDRVNRMVKMREAFRPFAPAVSAEEVHRWFAVSPGAEFPFMISTVDVRPEHRAALPAVTHVNGSARVQTVSRADNAEFHELLRAVGETTGRQMVLNTSFNVKGQPIVNTPREALETYLSTGIDALFLGDVLVERVAQPVQSDLSAVSGSALTARRAGIHVAPIATASNTSGATEKVTASVVPTP